MRVILATPCLEDFHYVNIDTVHVLRASERARPSSESPVRSLNLTHSLSPPPRGGNPLKLKRSISGSLGPRSSTPIGRRGAPPRSHWPPSAASVPFPGSAWAPARWRTPRGVIGQFRSLKSRQNGTSFAPGVFQSGIHREASRGFQLSGKVL